MRIHKFGFAVAGIFVLASLASAQDAALESTSEQTINIPLVASDLSAPLSVLAAMPAAVPATIPAYRPLLHVGSIGPDNPDEAPEASAQTTLTAVPGLNFLGLGKHFPGFSSCGTPPDNNGAVGTTQYLQWINCQFAVFDKTTGTLLLGPLEGNTLWTGFADKDCASTNDGDPTARFDLVAKRWVLSQFSVANGATNGYKQCIAVSQTEDATGPWYRYSYNFGKNRFNDYGKLAIWPDTVNNAYFMSFNIFNSAGTAFIGPMICAFDRANMLVNGTVRHALCLQISPTADGDFYLPSDYDGGLLPPAGSPNYAMAVNTTTNSALKLRKVVINFTAGTIAAPKTDIAATPFTRPCAANFGSSCVPQPGTAQKVDTLSDRILYRLPYHNYGGGAESLLAVHDVVVGGRSAVRWYEITNIAATPMIRQSGNIAPSSDTKWRWMGSISRDKAGNILVGYSQSSKYVYPSIVVTGRAPTDPLGTMQAEVVMQAGAGSDTGPYSRWGDYTHMSIDPVDGCTFWYTNEYYQSNGNSFSFDTRVGNFKFPNCH